MINAGLSQNTIAKMKGVLWESDLTLTVLYYIMDELDDLLLPYQIDLSIWHLIDDLALREYIERVGQPFYTRATAEIALPTP